MVVFTLCSVVWGRSALWSVVFRVGTCWVPRVTSIVVLLCCAMFPGVLVLCRAFCGAALCRGVRFCVLRWGWFGVGLCLGVLCGAVSCGVVACLVAFRCGALLCGLLRCVVLLLLILVSCEWFLFCGVVVVLWHGLWPFLLLCGFLMACSVGTLVARHCCVVWRRVTCCCVLSPCRMVLVLCRGVMRVVLSCRVVVRWVVCLCVAFGIVTRCCVLLLGGVLHCVACCVALSRILV